jgi:hypothetical protein
MFKSIPPLARLAIPALCLAATARAEIILELEERDGDEVFPVQMVIGESRLVAVGEDGEVEMIFDSATETIYTLDHDSRSYTRLNRENIGELAGQVDSAMAEMRRQLESLPPEQRAMAEQMMGALLGQQGDATATRPERRMQPTGERGEAAGVACRWYDVLEDRTRVGTACVAPSDSVPGGREMVAMMSAMSNIYDELLTRLADSLPMGMPANPILPMTEIDGLPIRSTEQREGEEPISIVLLAVREEAVDAALFQLPAGYREASFAD